METEIADYPCDEKNKEKNREQILMLLHQNFVLTFPQLLQQILLISKYLSKAWALHLVLENEDIR